MKWVTFLVLVTTLLTASCASMADYTIAKRSSIDKQIAAARAETEAKLKTLSDQQINTLTSLVDTHKAREQAAADYLFKAEVTFNTIQIPTRPEMVMGQSIQQTATQLPPASPAVQAKTFQDLKTELDEAKITNDQLKAQYEKELGAARAEGAAKDTTIKTLDDKLKTIDQERVTVLTKAKDTEAALSDERKKVDDAVIAAKTKEADNAKALQTLKTKASFALGIVAILCTLGAIYSPAFKQQMVIGAAVFGVAAVGVWYIQPWHIALVVGLGIVVALAWAAKNHYIESRAASGVYRAIQTVKDTAKDDYDKILKPHLDEWLTRYDKAGNKVPDHAAIDHIDSVLIKTDAK